MTIDLTGPPRPWPDRLRERFAERLDHGFRDRPGWHSPAPQGEPELLGRLAELFGCPPERTVVVGGVRPFAAALALATATARVETPGFADIPEIVGAGRPVRALRWNELHQEPLAGPPGLVWLTSPFRNPDGRSIDTTVHTAVETLAARGHTVVVNQVYRWFTGPAGAAPAPSGAWTVTSLAKIAGGGMRLGWALAPPGVAIPRPVTGVAPPTAWQRACAAFLDGATWQALWSACVEPTRQAQAAFARRAGELLGWRVGDGPCMLLSHARLSEPAMVAALREHGLMVSPGQAFHSPVPAVRLAFSGVTATQALTVAEVLARLGPGWRSLQVP
jgi:DNA-binding transcriptional MocR family regulator